MWNYPFTLHVRLNAGCKIECQHTQQSQKKKKKKKKWHWSSCDTQWSCHQKTNFPVTRRKSQKRCINHPATCNNHAIKIRIVLQNTTIPKRKNASIVQWHVMIMPLKEDCPATRNNNQKKRKRKRKKRDALIIQQHATIMPSKDDCPACYEMVLRNLPFIFVDHMDVNPTYWEKVVSWDTVLRYTFSTTICLSTRFAHSI